LGRRAAINAKKRNRRIITISIVVVIIASVVVLTLVVLATNKPSPEVGKPVSSTIMQQLTGVSDSTLSSIGHPSGVTLPNAIAGPMLSSGGKPEVVYIGGDYCPYCAVERWSLIVALSRFGAFSGLEYMQSSSTDVNPNSPTFTFSNATFTSSYITFVGVEEFDRSGAVRQALTSDQQTLITNYDTCPSTGQGGGIPFVDIANQYTISCGAQSTLDVSGQNWTQIASVLNTPSSNTAQLIDGAANTIISAVCNTLKTAGQSQPSVCSQSYATLTLAFTSTGQLNSQSLALVAQTREETRWTGLASHS